MTKVKRKRKYSAEEISLIAEALLDEKSFTWPSELADECGCSWYLANKILLELTERLNLKIHYAGRTKLFLDV